MTDEPRTLKGLLLQMKLGNFEERILAEEMIENMAEDAAFWKAECEKLATLLADSVEASEGYAGLGPEEGDEANHLGFTIVNGKQALVAHEQAKKGREL